MIMKSILSHAKRMLVMAICLCATWQVNAITIKVQKGGTAPYLYAWTGSSTQQTDAWPGTQFTTKDDNGYWTMDIPNQTTVNLILNMGDGQPQTADYLNIPGVNGNITILYDGKNTMFGTMPSYSYQEGKVAYFASPSTWDGNLYCKIKHNSYEEAHQMTKIGTDGMGLDVYADFNFKNWDDTPQYIQFYDTSNHHVEYMNYTLGGYYNAFVSYPVATFYSLSSANGFTDDNFRAGIAAQAGINDGDVFTPSSITKLDVSGRGITSLAGINHFAMLIELNASDNALTTADLGSNANLEILNLSKNTGLHGFSSYYSNNSNTYINIATNNSNLKELYLTDCTIGSFQAIKNHYGVSSLERLDLSNNPNMHGWSSGIAAQTGLKYLNLSNNNYPASTAGTTSVLSIPSTFTSLDTLIVDNNPNLGNISTLSNATNLRYVSLQNCGLTNSIGFGNNTKLEYINISNNSATAKNFNLSNNPALKVFKADNAAIKQNGLTWTTASPNLDTLIVSNNGNTQYLNSLHYASGLKYLDMSHGDLYLQSMPTFVGSNFPSLEYIDFSNDKITEAKTLQDFPALKTLKIGGNYLTSNSHGIDRITLSNCPAIETIDVSGSLNMAEIGLVNQGYNNSNFTLPTITYSNCHLLSMLDMSNNGFTSVPELTGIPSTIVSLKLNNNALSSLAMPTGSPIQFLYAENNAGFTGDYELTATAAGNLKGLDLGNNGFTSFKAEGTALSALMIGDNTSLATLELHGNNNLTCTTAETTMSEGSGLYLLGNTNLATINIENSKFNNIGANGSLYGLSKVKTLRASHNEFKTFTNSNYSHEDSRAHTLSNIAGKPSLEDLTGLEYLDLSYNLIKDSVHLYRNTELKRLDVSHNQILGPLPTTEAERTAMIDKKLKAALKYGKTYNGGAVGKSVELTDAIRTALTKEDPYRNETRYADFRPCDLRDTTGIFHLDLTYNTKLEYIDISYTNIHNTAAGREYMNPGWETNEGEDSWYSWVDTPAPNQNYGSVKHHFIWMQPAGANLRVFKCDHNNMQSLGTVYYANLDTLSASHMYGDCLFVAGHAGDHIGWGSKEFNNGNCRNARYIDFSYGNYYSFTPTNLTNVEKLILTGNPLGGGHYSNYVLDVTHNSKLQQLQADECGSLQTIEAHHLDYLSTLDVTNDTYLKTLRAYNDPLLYKVQTEDFITGLASCTALEELWVSEDNLRTLNIDANTNLETLKCYDNFKLPELVLNYNTKLSYLDFHNCKLNDINLQANQQLTYLNCNSPRIAEHIDEDGINKLSDLDIHSDKIETVLANCNNLYRMTGLNQPTLTTLEFEHNHINGIDLSNTGLNASTLKDADNGRTIVADYTIVTVKDVNNNTTHYDLYFFQLDSLTGSDGGVFIGNKYSQDPLKDNAYRENLNYEGMVSSQITDWTANAKLLNTNSKNSPIDLGDVESLIDPDRVIGTIVVLDEGPKHAEYTYDTGVSGHTSTYYLDWDAPSVITAVTEIENDNKPTMTGGVGAITIQAPEGTAIMVYDMAGRLVQQATASDGEVVIDGMSPGVYIVNGEKVIVK